MYSIIFLGLVVLLIMVAAIVGWVLKIQVKSAWTLLVAPNLYAYIIRHILVIGLLVLFLTGIKWYTVGVAEEKAGRWLTYFNGVATTDIVGPIKADLSTVPTPSPTTLTPSPTPTPIPTPSPTPSPTGSPTATPTPPPTAAEQDRLSAQLRETRDRIKHHGDVMAFFYVNYFVAIVMVMVAGLIVAATLFLIASKGWTGTSSYVEAIFIVASMWAAFYGLFPPVFQQEKNITDNKELFLKYKVLESELESYPVTGLTIADEQKTPREFIVHVDAEMARLGNIALGFDVSKINYQDAISLSKPTPATTNANNQGAPAQTKPKGGG